MPKKDKLDYPLMFKALGDPTRLKIVQYLQARIPSDDGTGPNVGEVCSNVTSAKKITSKVSHHLKELRVAGLISIERSGKNMICSLNEDAILSLRASLSPNSAASNSEAAQQGLLDDSYDQPSDAHPADQMAHQSLEEVAAVLVAPEASHAESHDVATGASQAGGASPEPAEPVDAANSAPAGLFASDDTQEAAPKARTRRVRNKEASGQVIAASDDQADAPSLSPLNGSAKAARSDIKANRGKHGPTVLG